MHRYVPCRLQHPRSSRRDARWPGAGELDFAGYSNDEDDGGLLMPGTITYANTCANTCPAVPPWMR
ncbi:hypothetical protein ACIGXA_33290 [Streptomyces fildesensis]|uniref:Uncharacterized protein n=1 Tax=Streptomyces fildesensis TaxID=375757 RepID=A0ABW8CG14_9ACTN